MADTDTASDLSKAIGSAPYLRTLARSVAVFWVKLPVICADPGMRSWMTGADCTTPSSTTASWHSAAWLVGHPGVVEIFSVRLDQSVWPLPVKSTLTIQRPVEAPVLLVSMVELALLTAVPLRLAGRKMYFAAPLRSQATSQSVSGALLALVDVMSAASQSWMASCAWMHAGGVSPLPGALTHG